jgi:AcrR family transcriptional regulator
LLTEGVEQPSVRDVAERAKVSVRSVFQHYNDMESLYTAMVQRQEQRVAVLLEPIPVGLPLYERVRELVERRDAYWSSVAPVRRGIRHHASARRSQVIEDAMQRMRRGLARQTTTAFANELRNAADAEARIARIEAMTSFEMWDHLRRVQHVSRASVRDQMTAMLLNEIAPKL